MPESIGSLRRVLPPGVVCDWCNNYFARKVEQPVLNHNWMRNLRAWYQVPSKKGNYPSLVGRIAGTDVLVNMRKNSDGELCLATEKGNEIGALEQAIARNFESPLIFTIEDQVPKREVSRFLAKMALEANAELLLKSPDVLNMLIDEPFYDRIRNFARYGTGQENWPFSQRRIFPAETMMRHPKTNEWVMAGFGCAIFMTRRNETLFAFVFYGVEFVMNVGGPSIRGYEEWLEEHGGISPLVERLGCRLMVRGEGRERAHYLEGQFNEKTGFDFDIKHGWNPIKENERTSPAPPAP